MPAGAGTGTAERRDADPHGVRGARRLEREGAGEARRVDHDVGPGEQSGERGVVGSLDDHRPLAGAPGGEAQRASVGPERRHAPEVVALGRLGLDDLGSEVGQDAAGHGGRLPGEVQDAQSSEQPFGHGDLRDVTAGPF